MRPSNPSSPAPPTGSSAPERSWHPPVATLAAHLRGELDPAEADPVREHVTACEDCIELLLDLDAFEQPPVEDADGPDAGAERSESWRRLLEQRPWDQPVPESPPDRPAAPSVAPAAAAVASSSEPRRRRRDRAPRWRSPLIAACLALATLSGLWALHLHRQLSAPVPDHPIAHLEPDGATRSGMQPGVFAIPPGASFTATLVPEAEGPFERYEAVILDAQGTPIWRGHLRPDDPTDPYPVLSLGLSRRMLSARRYTLRLRGLEGGRRTDSGSYPIEFSE